MAHLHKKIKKGRPYYYVREIKRVDGKPKVVKQIYIGTPARIAELAQAQKVSGLPQKLHGEEFGALFIAGEIEKRFGTVGIVDSIIGRGAAERGPSVGQYFFFAWANRMIEPRSKNALEKFYRRTAVAEVMAVDITELTSQKYWEKWNRVGEADVREISKRFFQQVWKLQESPPECLLFDTTNYFTYMASKTSSKLALRGNSKASKHHLRQVGLAVLLDRETHLPLYYLEYPGNQHDSKVFNQVIDEMFRTMDGFNATKQKLTVVFDKGMNSQDNIGFIDENTRIHFITTYSTYFADDLACKDLKHFSPVDIEKNRWLEQINRKEDKLTAYRTKRQLWGKMRTVVVTYNPRTARKREFTTNRKLERLREFLLEARQKYNDREPHWRDPEAIRNRYIRACEALYIGSQYFVLDFGGRKMSFKKDIPQVIQSQQAFGKNIIVTDNTDWTNERIIQASLDRYGVEHYFRSSKSKTHITTNPMFHWTDNKIRCHFFTCVMAMTAMKYLEIMMKKAGINMSAKEIMEEMRTLRSTLVWPGAGRTTHRMIEEPTKTQREVLNAFGYDISSSGVLQRL